jgi:hypothetical protein
MFTVEFEADASIITTLDQQDAFEDVEMVLADDGTIYIRQFDEQLEEFQMIYMSAQQWLDLITAYQSPEGAYVLQIDYNT